MVLKKLSRILLVAIVLWAPPAAAVCELACDAEPASARTMPATEHAGHHENHDANGAEHAAHHDSSESSEGCCCFSQSFAAREGPAKPGMGDFVFVVALPQIQPIAALLSALPEDPPRSGVLPRPPSVDRNLPLLI